MHITNVSSENVQKNHHRHVKKGRQRELHDFENVSIDRFIEHHWKNSEVHHKQENLVNNESALIAARHVHEMSKSSINWNSSEIIYRTNSHDMKIENESNDHVVEFKRN
jgi:hypothetical protein